MIGEKLSDNYRDPSNTTHPPRRLHDYLHLTACKAKKHRAADLATSFALLCVPISGSNYTLYFDVVVCTHNEVPKYWPWRDRETLLGALKTQIAPHQMYTTRSVRGLLWPETSCVAGLC